MVCIAAFIILCLVGIFVAFASIFKRSLGARYLKALKKSFGCFGKKIRLQKCETDFKSDVKNSMLKKVVLKHPRAVKPLSALIEVLSVILVLITVWSIIEVIKAGLALWTFGTCNVSQPASCTLSSEMCSIDGNDPQNPVEYVERWFGEWGEIFTAIPDRLHDWRAEDYAVEPYTIAGGYQQDKPYALDILDPGCSVCMQSYRNQKSSGFFDRYNTILMVYPIKISDTEYKFPNSDLIARYFYAARVAGTEAGASLIDRLFTGSDSSGVNYQTVFAELSSEEAEQTLQSWLHNFGISNSKVTAIAGLAHSDRVSGLLQQIDDAVTKKIHAKGIPSMIYDNKLHAGLYEAD